MKLAFNLGLMGIVWLISFSQLIAQTIQFVNPSFEPVEHVQVTNIRTGLHYHSNAYGEVDIEQSQRLDTFEIQHIAYQTQRIPYSQVIEGNQVQLEYGISKLNLVEVSANQSIQFQVLPYLSTKAEIDLRSRPIASSQDFLQYVPGLITAQHAGGGKAEQIFLRGFDIDHGTDLAITFNGVPVNMVSHAHGQGYADLHFIIPELISSNQNIIRKGVYHLADGNFSTAGSVHFQSNSAAQNFIQQEVGSWNTNRTVLIQSFQSNQVSGKIAFENLYSDGPFESKQGLNRRNMYAEVRLSSAVTEYQLWASHFSSKWNHSGQIPQRAVDQGIISRFGAIDDTEGGNTSRSIIGLQTTSYFDQAKLTSSVYLSKYDFELLSNFTFFLENPERGDQIIQKEARNTYGGQLDYQYHLNNKVQLLAGISSRNDQIDGNLLAYSVQKQSRDTTQVGDIQEMNQATYAGLQFQTGPWSIYGGLRYEHFYHQYNSLKNGEEGQYYRNIGGFYPKLDLRYQLKQTDFRLAIGNGFHSNDTRTVLLNTANAVLPRATGMDIGFSSRKIKHVLIDAAFWALHLEDEFVYVGDGGNIENSGESLRYGVDAGIRYIPNSKFQFDADLNYAIGTLLEEEVGTNAIPLVPRFTSSAGILFEHKGFSSSIRFRAIDDRPANEDNSIQALGYQIFDTKLSYTWKRFTSYISIENILNTEWNAAQFATESRLQNEPLPVEELHFTPGNPRNFRLGLKVEW